MALITSATNLFQVTSMAIIPKFPPVYMKTFLFGQGMSSIFNATLQVISLALGTSTETSALFYFIAGTLVIFLTWVLYLLVQHMSFYKYYMQIELEDKKKKHSKEDIKVAFFRVWPCLATMCLIFLTMSLTHPCITTLVVSENYGNGNKWNDTYFVPTITFLFTELCSQFGRLLSRPIITKSNGPWVVGLVSLRMIVLVPLVWFCNAQPRSHLSVLLPHDWQYILVLVLYFVTAGFLLNTSVLSIPQLAKEKVDVAYLLLLSTVGVGAGVVSPASLLAVRIL
ncbi:equilibrative nucleoside transporter 2-like [Anoplophora glabripennis]|uniref:equilibrative nucleoside transporter 2-like n=1 Tax=Anoplophora glabripennis TaxID=217634 RepID=UPI000C773E0F|nr:equilibrative nucleoside transporter 2-like [Anoplophora glabripennis]